MKKLFLLIGLVVFLAPMVVNGNDHDILDSHCLENTDNEIDVNDIYSNDPYNGKWKNNTQMCEMPKLPQYKWLTSTALNINNNDCSFMGKKFNCRSGPFEDVKLTNYGEQQVTVSENGLKWPDFKSQIIGSRLFLKTNDERFENCNFEFLKISNETNISKIQKQKKIFCFCIDDQEKAFSRLKDNNEDECARSTVRLTNIDRS